ncbi:MAG TPA: hypothetical protein DCR71_00585 [Dehalococcoidia bacterium]|jgi:hypothetical protein|nr:hypothetical protein [Dehalococcoidia bacterium]HBR22893.1 hypothetical protein [Nitrospiraceae bacterium]
MDFDYMEKIIKGSVMWENERLRDALRWRKYPEEKPTTDGVYLIAGLPVRLMDGIIPLKDGSACQKMKHTTGSPFRRWRQSNEHS